MTDSSRTLPDSIFPAKMQILSGSALKLLAIIIMAIDHTAHVVLSRWLPAMQPLFVIGNTEYSLYRICRDIGRSAFPIFCFLLIEGFLHTSNRFRYGRNLFLFALLSEIPFNCVFQVNSIWDAAHQNVFFTLFFGYLAMCAWEYFENRPLLQGSCLTALCVLSYHFRADYGIRGFLFILLLYFLRHEKLAQTLMGSFFLYWEWKACFAFLSLNMYNGKRGFIRGKFGKYFFYIFYPLHLVVLEIIRYQLFFK